MRRAETQEDINNIGKILRTLSGVKEEEDNDSKVMTD